MKTLVYLFGLGVSITMLVDFGWYLLVACLGCALFTLLVSTEEEQGGQSTLSDCAAEERETVAAAG